MMVIYRDAVGVIANVALICSNGFGARGLVVSFNALTYTDPSGKIIDMSNVSFVFI